MTVGEADDRADREATVLERIEAHRRRRPRLTDEVVTMAHGAGGKASAALVDAVFLGAFAHDASGPLADAAILTAPAGDRLAFTTDSFVVQPLRFPGGSIGHLAVHGTVNDLAVSGARPLALSAASWDEGCGTSKVGTCGAAHSRRAACALPPNARIASRRESVTRS
jgi:hydrogenase expression/formation protein HypE